MEGHFKYGAAALAVALCLVTSASAEVRPLDCGGQFLEPRPRTVRVAGFAIPMESTGEVELPLADIIEGVATSNGKVLPALRGMRPGRWFRETYAAVGAATPAQMLWSDVSVPDRLRLVREANQKLETSSFHRRRVAANDGFDWFLPSKLPGLQLLRSPDANQVSHYFQPALEFVLERTNIDWVELHLRGPFAPSTVADTLKKAFPKSPSLHVHGPVPLDMRVLAAEGIRGAALRTDFYMRANAFAEMATVIYRKASLAVGPAMGPNAGTGPLVVEGIADAAARFLGNTDPRDAYEIWATKNAFVGLRDDELYDSDELVKVDVTARRKDFRWFGLEYRFLRAGKSGKFGEFSGRSWPVVLDFLDTARAQLEYGHFGIMADRIDLWMAMQGTLDATTLGGYMMNSWWRSPTLFKFDVQRLPATQAMQLRFAFEKQEEVAALVFDWGRFPLVMGDPALGKRIRDAQREALASMKVGDDLRALSAQVLWNSGLFQTLAETFGVSVPAP